MKFRNITSSLLTATALLTTTFPAFAGPFDVRPSGIFRPNDVIPGAVGNVNKSTPSTPSNPVGNSEIQGLGDHQSWVDNKTLANDPRALCSDVGLGNNTRTSSSKIALATSTSTRTSSSRSHNDGGGGGVSILGIGVSGSGASQGSQNNSESRDSRTNRNEENSSSSATVVQGKNCDAFVNAAAARDINYQDNLTRRYEIKTGRRGQQVNQLLQDK
ncbi:hypothetical protein H6G80_21410 [Nostoc sp. FACHB-87]|uniref:hypothetical protein n=1 Tax=Nostocaceae TaxID=1162 RepID=UPI001683B818|nr:MULTISPECIES: hypothetical protein [Nostocaceae]MBD2302163.1 hypothetical protein [Nostoc sp. FACHB-190]MBD2456625.1 hypothetical protein [Nostoc sp. FACHB-87]MBD2477973.1 hypothetical protein [Anabaena sp. FACHB-83]